MSVWVRHGDVFSGDESHRKDQIINTKKNTSRASYMKSWWITPLKIDMEHNHGGLEEHLPF